MAIFLLCKIASVREASEFFLVCGCEDRVDGSKHWSDACEFGIEIGCVSCRFNSWFVWWGNSLVIDIIPVDVLKERMGHDLFRISRTRAKTMFGFSCEELMGPVSLADSIH